jgi:RNA polymerase sigma factor for flagellar operon FliA
MDKLDGIVAVAQDSEVPQPNESIVEKSDATASVDSLLGFDEARELAREFAATTEEPNNRRLKEQALRAYSQQISQAREDKLILEYLPMVHKIVQQVVTYLQPPLSREDLISAGTIGLVKAARDFDPTKDAEFKTYAYIRVRGSVIDELRGWSFTPVALKKQFAHAQEVLRRMTENGKAAPTDEQLAERLGVPLDKMYKMFETARARHFLSIHGVSDEAPSLGSMLSAADTVDPGEGLEKAELLEALTKAITALDNRQRRIIVLYYNKELTMKQIASILEITESRVSQLHASALFKLSVRLKRWRDGR